MDRRPKLDKVNELIMGRRSKVENMNPKLVWENGYYKM